MPRTLADALRDFSGLYNYAEVVLWTAMGTTLLVASRWRAGSVRRNFVLAGLVLLAFGGSDYVEANTGNEWWRPWWLFVWKAGCVLALVLIVIDARFSKLRRRRPAKANSTAHDEPRPQPSPGEGAMRP